MKRSAFLPVALVIVALLLSGCVPLLCSSRQDGKQMYELGAKLILLSAAVEGRVRYEDVPAGISEEELLILATRHDPSLLEPFKPYLVKVLPENRHAVILICSKDGSRGLLEDAGCSRPMDKHLWQSEPPAPCRFTLSVTSVCGAN